MKYQHRNRTTYYYNTEKEIQVPNEGQKHRTDPFFRQGETVETEQPPGTGEWTHMFLIWQNRWR